MTSITITPDVEKKTAKVSGVFSAGEHVSVTVKGFASRIGSGSDLKLRVMCFQKTVAAFPLVVEGASVNWTPSGGDACCELNMNTIPARKYCRGAENPCIIILEDSTNHQLYCVAEYYVCGWPRNPGIDEPVDLDQYERAVQDLMTQMTQISTILRNHIADKTSNPHHVTKDQVGLGRVNNTSDAEKPLSNDAIRRFNEVGESISGVSNKVDTFIAKFDFSTLSELDSHDSDRATKNLLNAILSKLKGLTA